MTIKVEYNSIYGDIMKKQIKSRQRVADHGEVYTAEREVKAMCDLVSDECNRIDSRFLEPACGDGNFLAEILGRKLAVVKKKYKKSVIDYEKNSLLAVSSIYGIELLPDNAATCRERLLSLFRDEYVSLYGNNINQNCLDSISYLLSKNIIIGNALTYHRVDNPKEWIIISEWSMLGSGMVNRRDYEFNYLVGDKDVFSDLPCLTFEPVYFLRLNPEAYGE